MKYLYIILLFLYSCNYKVEKQIHIKKYNKDYNKNYLLINKKIPYNTCEVILCSQIETISLDLKQLLLINTKPNCFKAIILNDLLLNNNIIYYKKYKNNNYKQYITRVSKINLCNK